MQGDAAKLTVRVRENFDTAAKGFRSQWLLR
jgi:hypothetical protein